jgi:NAD(P)-dependent dehydrogenase (short-subunit alcohol dehydrogenase family)
VDSILAARGSAEFLQGDMSRLDDIRRVFDRIGETHGKLDILVNNAGFNLFKGVLDTTPEDFDSIINLDLRGLFFATQAAVPLMKNAGADRWSTLPACMRSRPSATSPPTPPPRAVWSLSPVRYARNSARSASA